MHPQTIPKTQNSKLRIGDLNYYPFRSTQSCSKKNRHHESSQSYCATIFNIIIIVSPKQHEPKNSELFATQCRREATHTTYCATNPEFREISHKPRTQNPELKDQPFRAVTTTDPKNFHPFGRNSTESCFWEICNMISKSFGGTQPYQSYYSTMLIIIIISPMQQEPKNSHYSYNTISLGCSSHLLMHPSLNAINPKSKTKESALRRGCHIGIP